MEELAEPLLDLNKVDPASGVKDTTKDSKSKLDPVIKPCELHFIRCIKPNEKKEKDLYVHAMALQ